MSRLDCTSNFWRNDKLPKHFVASHLGVHHRDLLENVPTSAYGVAYLRYLLAKAHGQVSVERTGR